MDAGKILINGIFNGSQLLEVPFYQRAYVWKEEQWDRLLEDMEFVTRTKKPYFLGSIILKNGKAPATWEAFSARKIIIDGQQRLTTLIILMKVLCLKKKELKLFDRDFRLEDDSISLRHGKYDAKAFEIVMKQDKANVIENSSNSQIISAFNYFMKELKPDKIDRLTIKQNVQFVCIDLVEGEDEQQVFDTINSLGVRLTTAELLKNYFFHRDNEEEYENSWVKIFERDEETRSYWDQELEVGRLKRTMIDIFFDAFFQMFIQNKKYPIRAEDRLSYGRTERLSKSYQEFINTYCGGDKQVVLSQMADYARCFYQTFRPELCDIGIPAAPGVERLNVVIFGLKTTTFIPYVLYIAKNCADMEMQNQIYNILEAYAMRRMVVRAQSKNYNKLIESLITVEALDAERLLIQLSKYDDSTMYIPDDSELEEGFHKSKLANQQTRGILYMLESRIRPTNSAVVLMGINNYSLEHMMPKKWRNKWEPCADRNQERERDNTLLTLGNLAIIPQALNSSIRDSDWSTKLAGKGTGKNGLKECAAGLYTMYDSLEKQDWNEAEIDRRADWLFKQAQITWKLTALPEYEKHVYTADELMQIILKWADSVPEIDVSHECCDGKYCRFTTSGMNELFAETTELNSGWKTKNHYFYEIVLNKGKINTQFALSGKGMPTDQRELAERINAVYPADNKAEHWYWRVNFTTDKFQASLARTNTEIEEILTQQLEEAMKFELAVIKEFRSAE